MYISVILTQTDTSHIHQYVPGIAPTAPNIKEQPSIILASHSTLPDSVRLEPIPAFV